MAPTKPWRERIRHFTWAWHAMIMGTGVLSALCHSFPYGADTKFLKGLSIFFFILNFILFIWVMGMTIARYYMFPEVWPKMIRHPAQSLFIGCLPMGFATLINAAVNIYTEYNFGGVNFLYVLWGFWWLDSIASFIIAFGMIIVMVANQEHSLSKMTSIWILPIVSLIVASSSGGLIAAALRPHSINMALLTVGLSAIMVAMGLSLALMIITVYLMRLVIYGPPEPALILSSFIPLGPLGQAGFSFLLAGADFADLFPVEGGGDFPQIDISGQLLQASCFFGSFVLWSMGVAWIIIAFMAIGSVARKNKLPFSMGYWGLIFPHGVFATQTIQLGKTLDSDFFRVLGAMWAIGTLVLWIVVFSMTVPRVLNGSIFVAPYLAAPPPKPNPVDNIVDIGYSMPMPVSMGKSDFPSDKV